MNNTDRQYLEILDDVLKNGYTKHTRSGETLSLFGKSMRFNLQEGFPLLTTKKMYFRGILHELLWFLRGDTNIRYLVTNNVHIWDDDAYRFYCEIVKENNEIAEARGGYEIVTEDKEKFLEYVIGRKSLPLFKYDNGDFTLRNYRYGDLGPVYGKQWRNFGHSGKDQIQEIINTLKTNPDDRRMLCVAYNPDMIGEMALPPCHIMFQFYTRDLKQSERWKLYARKFKNDDPLTSEHLRKYGESKQYLYRGEYDGELEDEGIPVKGLSCSFYCRSQDLPLGTPYNIASYALLTHIIARCVNMMPDELIYNGGDCHIYKNQIDGVKEQLTRDPGRYDLPRLAINEAKHNLEDFTGDDFSIIGYESYPAIKFPLSVG